MSNEVYDKIIKIIVDNYVIPIEGGAINAETDLVNDLAFESIRLLELVVYLEEEFDIEFDDENLVMENFQTIHLITQAVETLLKNK